MGGEDEVDGMKADLQTKRSARNGSAELHSAVSQICNLRDAAQFRRRASLSWFAECNSAIQRITNLRYEAWAAHKSDKLFTMDLHIARGNAARCHRDEMNL